MRWSSASSLTTPPSRLSWRRPGVPSTATSSASRPDGWLLWRRPVVSALCWSLGPRSGCHLRSSHPPTRSQVLLVGVGEVTELVGSSRPSYMAQGSALADALAASFLPLSPGLQSHRKYSQESEEAL